MVILIGFSDMGTGFGESLPRQVGGRDRSSRYPLL